MNIRSLTRGDGAVIGTALLLLIASFFPFFDLDANCPIDSCSVSAWDRSTLPMLPTVHLLGLVAAGLFVAARLMPEGRKVLGLGLDQFGLVLCLVVGWSGFWSLISITTPDLEFPGISDPNENWTLGLGAFMTLIFSLAVAASGVLSALLPAMKAPLLPAPKPPNPYAGQQPGPYGFAGPQGGQPGQPGPYGGQPQGGYGYPGGTQGGQPGQPAQQGQPGQPAPQAQQPQPQPGQPQPGQPGQPQQTQQAQQPGPAAGGGAPDPNFQPFWFAVPVTRPLFGEDGAPQPVAELAPGTWYLAVDQRGQALVAQTQDGRRGVLQDTSGIQRG